MRIPAGKHTLEMRFEPRSYYTGKIYALFASLFIVAAFISGLVWFFTRGNAQNATIANDETPTPSAPRMPTPPLAPTSDAPATNAAPKPNPAKRSGKR